MQRQTTAVIIVMLLTLGCGSTGGYGDRDRASEILIDLESAAREALRSTNATLDARAADELATMWSDAAGRLADDEASSAEIAAAAKNVKIFIEAATRRSGGQSRALTSEDVKNTRLSICPLYPICR